MEVYKNDYVIYTFDYKTKMLKETWTAKTERLSDEFAKQIVLDAMEIYKKYRPELLLNDYRNFKYPITPDFQVWIDENIGKLATEVGVRKKASIVSPDIISQMSLEQTFEEKYISKIPNKYFENEEKALEWLLE